MWPHLLFDVTLVQLIVDIKSNLTRISFLSDTACVTKKKRKMTMEQWKLIMVYSTHGADNSKDRISLYHKEY